MLSASSKTTSILFFKALQTTVNIWLFKPSEELQLSGLKSHFVQNYKSGETSLLQV